MKKFTVAAMRNYTTAENLQFSKHVLKAFNQADARALKLHDPLLQLQTAVTALEAVFQESSIDETSIDVPAMDKRRIQILSGIRLLLKSRLVVKDPDTVKMARSVLNTVKQNCKDIQYGSLPHRTERIHAFIRDITTKPNLSASMESLNLMDEFSELVEVNQSIFDHFDEKKEAAQIVEKRKAIKAAYDTLMEQTQAFALVAEDKTAYEGILKAIDKHIERFNATAKLRKSLKKKATEVTDTVPETAVMSTVF